MLDAALAAAVANAAADAAPVRHKGVESVPGRYLLVDGDYLCYYCAGHDETTVADARLRLMQRLDDMRVLSGSEFVVLHLTATGSHKGHRYIVATQKPYQENRNGSKRPKNWQALRDFVESYNGKAFRQKIWGTREADDGICLHAKTLPFGKAVIAMKDKDSQMIDDAIHIDWDTFEITEVPAGTYELENSLGRLFGHKWFWLQLLMGDTADNIPGLPQIRSLASNKMVLCGKARARDVLVMSLDNSDAFKVVCSHYVTYYKDQWADRLVEQMALLWMRTDRDAKVDDFTSVLPVEESIYIGPVMAAAVRLVERVQEAIDATPDY